MSSAAPSSRSPEPAAHPLCGGLVPSSFRERVTVTQGTDPAGRPATVMTRTYTANAETDITYENPATGAVLAQVWKTGSDVNTAAYQPVTASNTPPPDPYPS